MSGQVWVAAVEPAGSSLNWSFQSPWALHEAASKAEVLGQLPDKHTLEM